MIGETTSQFELTGLSYAPLGMCMTARGGGGIRGDSRVLLPDEANLVFLDSPWTGGRTLRTGHKQLCTILEKWWSDVGAWNSAENPGL